MELLPLDTTWGMSRGLADTRQVPPGSVVMSEKFQGSELHTTLKGTCSYSTDKLLLHAIAKIPCMSQ